MEKEKRTRWLAVTAMFFAIVAGSLALKAAFQKGASAVQKDYGATHQAATPLAEEGANAASHPFDVSVIDPQKIPSTSSEKQFRQAVESWATASKIPALKEVQGGLSQTGDEADGQWSWWYLGKDDEGNPVSFEVLYTENKGYHVSVKY